MCRTWGRAERSTLHLSDKCYQSFLGSECVSKKKWSPHSGVQLTVGSQMLVSPLLLTYNPEPCNAPLNLKSLVLVDEKYSVPSGHLDEGHQAPFWGRNVSPGFWRTFKRGDPGSANY